MKVIIHNRKYEDSVEICEDSLEEVRATAMYETEAEREKVFDLVRKLRMYCIYANWDNPDTEDDFSDIF